LIDLLIEHMYSADIHSIECSWRLADVLACSQKVSYPEMKLVSAAIGVSFPLSQRREHSWDGYVRYAKVLFFFPIHFPF
jgi:hypothetical protein